MVTVAAVCVATAVVQVDAIAGRIGRKMTAIDTQTIEGPANLRWMHVEGGVVGGTVEAGRAKRVAVKMGLTTALAHVLVARIDLTSLRSICRTVVL